MLTCECKRNDDGRCEACQAVMIGSVQNMVQIMLAQQEKAKKEIENLNELCERCKAENMDLAVSKLIPLIGNQMSKESILAIVPALINVVAVEAGVEKWPLTEKALMDISK